MFIHIYMKLFAKAFCLHTYVYICLEKPRQTLYKLNIFMNIRLLDSTYVLCYKICH